MKGDNKRSGTLHQHGWPPHARRPARRRGVVACTGAVVALALSLSACGHEPSGAPGVAQVGSTTTSPPGPFTTQSTASPGPAGGSGGTAQELEFARCMRTNGVPSFPDPDASGGFQLSRGTDPSSPVFKAAQAKCQHFLPGVLGAGPAHPSTQAVAQMLKVSQCMRRHGILGFPDPTTSVPSDLTGIGEVSDRDGVILVFPRSLDTQSAAFARAAAACGFQVTNH